MSQLAIPEALGAVGPMRPSVGLLYYRIRSVTVSVEISVGTSVFVSVGLENDTVYIS